METKIKKTKTEFFKLLVLTLTRAVRNKRYRRISISNRPLRCPWPPQRNASTAISASTSVSVQLQFIQA